MSNFAERLKELMEDNNLIIVDLARKINMNHGNVGSFIAGNHLPTYGILVKFLYFFDCSADFILGLDEIPTEETLYPVLPFHERLRQVLREKKISGEKLKRDMHVSGSVYYNWTSGKALPTSASLIRLAEYLDCSIDYLIGRRR